MEEFRPALEPFYYDETRFNSYLKQLGVDNPSLQPDHWERIREMVRESP
jgi:aminobenzoyl-glutamate utilization protein B